MIIFFQVFPVNLSLDNGVKESQLFVLSGKLIETSDQFVFISVIQLFELFSKKKKKIDLKLYWQNGLEYLMDENHFHYSNSFFHLEKLSKTETVYHNIK